MDNQSLQRNLQKLSRHAVGWGTLMDKGKGLPGLFDFGSVSVGPQQKIQSQEFSPSLKDGLGTELSLSPRELRVFWPHASQQATPRGQSSRQPVISSLVSNEYFGSTQCIMELTECPPFTFMTCNAFISVAHESFQSRRPGRSGE